MRLLTRRHFVTLAAASASFLALQPLGAKDNEFSKLVRGQKLYTRFSLYYEELRHRTTNYRKGVLVPVNTEVQFIKARGSDIIVKLPDGHELRIENIEPYSGENLHGIFKRTFSNEKTDLSAFSESERKAILAGQVEVGMSKAAVVLALGYPPKHKTPSLDASEWRYWRNRFSTFLVKFDQDKVAGVKE